VKSSYFSPDIKDFIFFLDKHKVKYLIVGGEAVIYYGHTRLTGDVDFFFESVPENIKRLYDSLTEFWRGNIPGVDSIEDLKKPALIIQFGVPPNRIDLMNLIDNVSFSEAWKNKVTDKLRIYKKTIPIYFIGLDELIKNKEMINRPKDIEDLKYLRKIK